MANLHPNYREARRRLDTLFPKGVSPTLSIYLGNRWEDIMNKDPTGQSVLAFVEELELLCKPKEATK